MKSKDLGEFVGMPAELARHLRLPYPSSEQVTAQNKGI
jgi:hypothetical protein